jgi:PTH1 family peptidyl-tRNA hydrolase
MKLIVGLGNPGDQYANTRHNIGFSTLDALRKAWRFPDFAFCKKFNAEISEGHRSQEKILLVKPRTFMNLSGIVVRALTDFYKLSPNDIVLIQDELDLPLGKHKIAADSSSAGHNGVKNIIEHLGTQAFARLRIGIDIPERKETGALDAHDFVLSGFTPEERGILDRKYPEYIALVESLLEQP